MSDTTTTSKLPVTPQTSMKSKLLSADNEIGTNADEIAYIQSISPFHGVPDPVTYRAIDKAEEMQAKGTKPAENIEIVVLYTQEQHKKIKEFEKSDTPRYWFLKYPESTAQESGKPLVFRVQATCALAPEGLEIDGMIQEKITLYKSSEVEEFDGMPTEETEASE